MEHLRQHKTVLEPFAGSDIFDCINEAIVFALKDTVSVEFTHNGRLYVVDPAKVCKAIRDAGTVN